MSDNSVICCAIQMADRAIRKAMTSPSSCEAEITLALGGLRYVEQELQRQGDESKIAMFAVMDPMQTVGSLAKPGPTETPFCERAKSLLDALEQLKGICGCPN
jgi:hypothetical protein